MTHEEYVEMEGINCSKLKDMMLPLLYRYRMDHPRPDAPALSLGRLVHCMVLESEEFSNRYAPMDKAPKDGWRDILANQDKYAVYPGKVRRGKAYDAFAEAHQDSIILLKREWDAAMDAGAQVGDRDVISYADATTAATMAEAVRGHRAANEMLSGGRAEVPITWRDPDSTLLCKGRLDYLRPTRIVDLKTARSVAARDFGQAAARFLYHMQMAFYHDGAVESKRLPADAENPVLVSVQSAPPWDVAVDILTDRQMEAGRQLYGELLQRLLDCQSADYWPGACPHTRSLELPNYAPGMEDLDEEGIL